jgi:DNA-binding response OmpR family regulator
MTTRISPSCTPSGSTTHAVRTANDGETALWHFDTSVDVVLLDRRLPDMGGEELLGQLKESDVEYQFAMLMGVEQGFEILKLDIDEYVRKPIERKELRELVGRLEERNAVEGAMSSCLGLSNGSGRRLCYGRSVVVTSCY